jgi:type VI secretion system secreted protein Hcp
MSTTDYFLKLDGIEGESQDSKRPKEIQLTSWSWGMSNSGSAHTGQGGATGRVNVGDLNFTKYVDKASPSLIRSCAGGTIIPTGTLTIRKTDDKDKIDYLVIELKEILVSSWQTGGSGGGGQLSDSFSLNFAEYEFKYTLQQDTGGKGGSITTKGNARTETYS